MTQNDYINAIIRDKMREQELTLKTTSNQLGVPLTTLHYRINGKYQWTVKEINTIANTLDIPADKLLFPQLYASTTPDNNEEKVL